jgi:hypothetical protein
MLPIGSNIHVKGYSEIHKITGVVGDYGYITCYPAVYQGRPVLMENLYVPLKFASAV